MKIHTDHVHISDMRDFIAADERLKNVALHLMEISGSRSHGNAFVIRLTGSNKSAPQNMPGCKAATWDEWGWFLAAIFDAEPTAKCGHYKDREHFNEQTNNRFATLVRTF
jgi:hypothetical protein